MSRITTAGLAAVAVSLAATSTASAHPGHHGPYGDLHAKDLRKVPARVATRLKKAERAVQRAEDYADDGESAKAITALTSARKNLASALKVTVKYVAADSDRAVPAANAYAIVADDIAATTAADFDEQTGDLVDALGTTLQSAVDGRDDVVDAITALSDTSDYADVAQQISDDIDDETSDITDALSDDTLTDAAKTALQNAATADAATKAKTDAIVTAADSADSADEADFGPAGFDGPPPPPHGGGDRGFGGPRG